MQHFLVKRGIELFLEQWDFFKNSWKWILRFALIYTLVFIVFTFLPRFQQAIELEQKLYDSIQKEQTIDSEGDAHYDKYKEVLGELIFINFDTAVINKETDRLKPEKLVAFLRKISPYNSKFKALFIDYAVRNLQETDSSNLAQAMQPFGERLILPYVFDIAPIIGGTDSQIDVDDFKGVVEYPMYSGGSLGYVTTFKSSISDDYRLYKYRTDDEQHYSVPYKLCELIHGKEVVEQRIENFGNAIMEINFLLRNRVVDKKLRAVLPHDLSDFINGKISELKIEELLENKIVCVGLFGEYINKYGQYPDKFITPVDNEMSGSLLLVNAYLNLATDSYLQRGSYLWLFLINFIIGCMFGTYYTAREKGVFNLLWGTVGLLVINSALTYILYQLLSWMMANAWYLSLGMTLFLALQSIIVYLVYSEVFKKNNHKNLF